MWQANWRNWLQAINFMNMKPQLHSIISLNPDTKKRKTPTPNFRNCQYVTSAAPKPPYTFLLIKSPVSFSFSFMLHYIIAWNQFLFSEQRLCLYQPCFGFRALRQSVSSKITCTVCLQSKCVYFSAVFTTDSSAPTVTNNVHSSTTCWSPLVLWKLCCHYTAASPLPIARRICNNLDQPEHISSRQFSA